MLVKKELNQKKDELEIAHKEYKETRERNKREEIEKSLKLNERFYKTEEECAKIKEELDGITDRYNEAVKKNQEVTENYNKIAKGYEDIIRKNEKVAKEYNRTIKKHDKVVKEHDNNKKIYNEIKEQIKQETKRLANIKQQQQEQEQQQQAQINTDQDKTDSESQITQQNEEINPEESSKVGKTKEDKEESKSDKSSDDKTVTKKSEKDAVLDSQNSSAGIIKAAGIVVRSLKTKLSLAQKELETLQAVLKKEREAHARTKAKLKKLVDKEKNKS